MIFDIDMIRNVYEQLPKKIEQAKNVLQTPPHAYRENSLCPSFA